MDSKISRLRQMIAESESIVFFGGAGVSTESGIPDFRSVDGLYHQKFKHPPEVVLSGSFFKAHPEDFYEFFREKLSFSDVRPNTAHYYLAALEREGKLKAVLTQNVDGLHQAAGSKNVLELHGTVTRFYCSSCGKKESPEQALADAGVPRCDCGGVIRPDVVLYEEGLDEKLLLTALSYLAAADMLIVGGTSLNVYPAAGLIQYYRGTRLVLVNKEPTPFDAQADLVIHDKIGAVFSQLSSPRRD